MSLLNPRRSSARLALGVCAFLSTLLLAGWIDALAGSAAMAAAAGDAAVALAAPVATA